MLEDDDPHGGFRLRPAITGEQKLRTYHIRGRQDDLRQPASEKGSEYTTTAGKLPGFPLKEEHCFKSLGVWYDTTERDQQGTQLRSARGSAEAIAEVLRGAIIAMVAYYGGLPQCSIEHISKNMRTPQAEALFQPCTMGGYGFPRLSHVIQDR